MFVVRKNGVTLICYMAITETRWHVGGRGVRRSHKSLEKKKIIPDRLSKCMHYFHIFLLAVILHLRLETKLNVSVTMLKTDNNRTKDILTKNAIKKKILFFNIISNGLNYYLHTKRCPGVMDLQISSSPFTEFCSDFQNLNLGLCS